MSWYALDKFSYKAHCFSMYNASSCCLAMGKNFHVIFSPYMQICNHVQILNGRGYNGMGVASCPFEGV